MTPQPIDFVLPWVDGADPAWLALREQYPPGPGEDARPERYRDWGLLRYWFRGVEAFAPWVRQVHLVTWGHVPPWLNTDHPRLRVVRHEDFMPPGTLPVFNINALEVNLHRIPGLAEQFVYFNDDVLLLGPAAPEDFFREGRPVDMLALQPVVANPENPVMSHLLLNNSLVISRHFHKKQNMAAHRGKYFHLGYPLKYFGYNLLETVFPRYTGFYTVHGPSPLLRATYEELWAREPDLLAETSRHRFRGERDVTQYLFREWQKQQGDFVPANLHRGFAYLPIEDTDRVCRVVTARRKKVVCINDTSRPLEEESVRARLTRAFEGILPQPSSFER